jgi:hypothetical protein
MRFAMSRKTHSIGILPNVLAYYENAGGYMTKQ